MKVAEAFVEISARFDKMRDGLRRAVQVSQRSADTIQRRFGRLARAMRDRLGAAAAAVTRAMRRLALAIAASGAALLLFLDRISAGIDAQAKFAARIGTTTQVLRELEFAAAQSGIKAETLRMALQRLTRRSAEAAMGTGEAKDAIAELGFVATDFVNLPVERQLRQIARAFARVENPAHRVRLASKLFDLEGVALVQLLQQGESGIDSLTRRFRDLNGVVGEEAVGAFVGYRDSLNELKVALNGLAVQALRPVVEWLSKVATGVADVVAEFGGLGNLITGTLSEAFRQVGERVADLMDIVASALTDSALLAQSMSALSSLIPGAVGDALSKQGTDVANSILAAAERAASRARAIREQLEGSRRGASSNPPLLTPPPTGRPNPTAPAPFGGFRPTSGPLDRPLAQASAAQSAIAAAVRASIQSVGTAIGGFRTGIEDRLQRDMLSVERRQLALLQDIRDEVLSGGGGAFT